MTYRAGTIKRERRTKARVAQLDAQIIAVLKEDHPQSVRHVFYRMTDPRLPEPVEKSDRGYRHVQERCVNLRRYPCGGFSSLSFIHQAAEQNNATDDGRPLVVFYIGDYDPAGVLIDVSLERELREHLKPSIELDFRRIAINEHQIEQHNLPTKPRKESDKRSLHIKATVEAEAMPARDLRHMLRAKVESLLPANALRIAKVAEESERKHLILMANLLDGDDEDEGDE